MKKHVALRCVLSLATALLLALSPFTAALAEPSSETLLLAEGTAAETQARIDDSGVEGPTIFFVAGTHGNEWAGYYAADELMEEIFPTAGKIIWVPRANIQACNIEQRTAEDEVNLNRVYPGDPEGNPVEQVAAEIMALIEQEQPVAVVDMHEGYNFYGVDGSIGNSLVLGATDGSFVNGLEIIIRVNARTATIRILPLTPMPPPAASTTRYPPGWALIPTPSRLRRCWKWRSALHSRNCLCIPSSISTASPLRRSPHDEFPWRRR